MDGEESMRRDAGFREYPFFIPPPHCPKDIDDAVLGYPSSAFVMTLLCLTSLAYFIMCISKYHTVTIFNKVISTPITSNTWWCVYFACVSAWSLVAAIKFALPIQDVDSVSVPLAIIDLVLYGLLPFSLSAALEHQYQHRNSINDSSQTLADDYHDEETLALYGQSHRASRRVSMQETDPICRLYNGFKRSQYLNYLLFVLLLILYWVFMSISIGAFGSPEEPYFYYTFVLVFALQRVPILLLGCRIVFDSALPYCGLLLPAVEDGPTRTTKAFLLTGLFFSLFDLVPISLWDQVFGGNHCPLWLFSWVDVFELLYAVACTFFFLFTPYEYFRGLEHELWYGEQTARYATYNPVYGGNS